MDQKDLHKLEKDQLQQEIASTTAVGKFTLSNIVTNYQSLDRIAKKAVRLAQRLIDENFKHQREQALLDNKLKETSKKVEQLKEKERRLLSEIQGLVEDLNSRVEGESNEVMELKINYLFQLVKQNLLWKLYQMNKHTVKNKIHLFSVNVHMGIGNILPTSFNWEKGHINVPLSLDYAKAIKKGKSEKIRSQSFNELKDFVKAFGSNPILVNTNYEREFLSKFVHESQFVYDYKDLIEYMKYNDSIFESVILLIAVDGDTHRMRIIGKKPVKKDILSGISYSDYEFGCSADEQE